MKILYVWPSAEFSTWDVARGLRSALERQGHDIADYFLSRRLEYHYDAMKKFHPEIAGDGRSVSRAASECVLTEALSHGSELVFIVSGLNFHPIGLWFLGKVGIPAAVLFTESPYDDEPQAQWADFSRTDSDVNLTIFTNDRYSAERYGWHYIPHAYDPAYHSPAVPTAEDFCDVLLIGTGWKERQAFLEAVNWTGIDLRIMGVWPDITDRSPLFKFYRPLMVDNSLIAPIYAGAKICLNFHRRHSEALSPNPRSYELAACAAFQLSDEREDMVPLFGDSVPLFDSPQRLEELVRYYLAHSDERNDKRIDAHHRVRNETFDSRAKQLLKVLDGKELLAGVRS